MKNSSFIFGLFLTLAAATGIWSCHSTAGEGERLYRTQCMHCHHEDGSGLKQLMPPLRNSSFMAQHQEKLACIIRYGMDSSIVVNGVEYHQPMPGNEYLSEVQITNLVNYISTNFGNKLPYVQVQEVQQQLKACAEE